MIRGAAPVLQRQDSVQTRARGHGGNVVDKGTVWRSPHDMQDVACLVEERLQNVARCNPFETGQKTLAQFDACS